jgi:glycosyltransferase involved in cell wall biosynthesis
MTPPTQPTLALLPAFNEAACLASVVAELRAAQPQVDVLVVDDGSTDETPVLLRTLPVRWIRLNSHLGLGSAVRTGLRYARAAGYSLVVRLDADGQHPPAELSNLLEPLRRQRCDAVVGSRFRRAGDLRASPLVRRRAQMALGRMMSLLTGRTVTDPTSGFWAFGPRAIQMLADIHPTGHSEPELAMLLSRNAFAVEEVTVTMRPRLAGRSSLSFGPTLKAIARTGVAMAVSRLRAREERP